MCFSAEASFTAGAILTAGGVATVIRIKSKKEIPLALLPLLFGIQQIIEGIQWVSAKPSCLSGTMAYAFLAFAFVLWPTYVPASVLLVEKNKDRRTMIIGCLVIGIMTSLYLLIALIKNPLTVTAETGHIAYLINLPWSWGIFPYWFATAGSCIFSRYKLITWLGATVTLGVIYAAMSYGNAFPSVWCFFAAVASLLIYFHFRTKYPETKP